MSRTYESVDIARQFLYVREAGANHGLRVEAIQHWSGGQPGDSWCCEFVWMVFDLCYQGECPFDRVQSVQALWDTCAANGWTVDAPQAGDLFFYMNDAGHMHHIGIWSGDGNGIAGNTSEDGTSNNGDRVAEHAVSATHFARIP